MFDPKYPNLELLEYMAAQVLAQKVPGFLEKHRQHQTEFDAIVFPQVWGSTCGGFDITPDGSPAIGGSALTKQYTTIFHELNTDTYVIYFGNRYAYMVNAPIPDVFFDDLRNRRMRPLSEALKTY